MIKNALIGFGIAIVLYISLFAYAHDPCAPDVFDPTTRQCEVLPPPPVDSDGDGIPDSQDLCPNEGDQGHGIDADGCPIPPPPPPPPPPVGSELTCGPEGGGSNFYYGAPNDMAGMAKVLCDGAHDRWVQAVDAYSWDPSFNHWSETRMVLDSDDTHWLIADVIPDNVVVEIRGARVVVEDYTGVNLDNIQVHSSASMVDIVGQGCTE